MFSIPLQKFQVHRHQTADSSACTLTLDLLPHLLKLTRDIHNPNLPVIIDLKIEVMTCSPLLSLPNNAKLYPFHDPAVGTAYDNGKIPNLTSSTYYSVWTYFQLKK